MLLLTLTLPKHCRRIGRRCRIPDPAKVEKAANNALVGSPETIAKQIVDRYHPEDRLMLWFDFFNHDNAHVSMMMEQFQAKVAPLVQQSLKTGE